MYKAKQSVELFINKKQNNELDNSLEQLLPPILNFCADLSFKIDTEIQEVAKDVPIS